MRFPNWKKILTVIIVLWLSASSVLHFKFLGLHYINIFVIAELISLLGFLGYLLIPNVKFKHVILLFIGLMLIPTVLQERIDWLKIAVENKNPFLCNFATSKQMSSNSSVIVIGEAAVHTCKVRYVAKVGDFEYCYQLDGEASNPISEKGQCFSLVARLASNQDICGKIPKEYFRYCAMSVAKHTGNSKLCLQIDDSYYQRDCLFETAQSLQDPSICQLISDKVEINRCITLVAASARKSEFCNLIIDLDYLYTKKSCIDRASK